MKSTNLGLQNATERPQLKYKRAYFVDWRAADRLKKQLLPKIDFLLDTNDSQYAENDHWRTTCEGLKKALAPRHSAWFHSSIPARGVVSG